MAYVEVPAPDPALLVRTKKVLLDFGGGSAPAAPTTGQLWPRGN